MQHDAVGRSSLWTSFATAVVFASNTAYAFGQAQKRPVVDTITYELSAPGRTQGLSVAAHPTLEILTPATGDGAGFHRIRAITYQADGTLIVANGDPPTLYFFNGKGGLLRSAGRYGGGPGEYTEPSSVHLLPGDSLLVFDRFARRCTILGPEGKYVRSFMLDPPFKSAGPTLTATLNDGTVVIGYGDIPASRPDPRPKYFTQRLYRYTTAGRMVNEVRRMPLGEHFVQQVPAEFGSIAYWDLTFGRRFAFGSLGNTLIGGDGSSMAVSQYSPKGELLRVHSVAVPRRRVQAADIRRYQEEDLRRTSPDMREL
ncbi:MAG: hypothetical protein ACREA0_35425, partial [bacterium]